jgi:hypothetical protein
VKTLVLFLENMDILTSVGASTTLLWPWSNIVDRLIDDSSLTSKRWSSLGNNDNKRKESSGNSDDGNGSNHSGPGNDMMVLRTVDMIDQFGLRHRIDELIDWLATPLIVHHHHPRPLHYTSSLGEAAMTAAPIAIVDGNTNINMHSGSSSECSSGCRMYLLSAAVQSILMQVLRVISSSSASALSKASPTPPIPPIVPTTATITSLSVMTLPPPLTYTTSLVTPIDRLMNQLRSNGHHINPNYYSLTFGINCDNNSDYRTTTTTSFLQLCRKLTGHHVATSSYAVSDAAFIKLNNDLTTPTSSVEVSLVTPLSISLNCTTEENTKVATLHDDMAHEAQRITTTTSVFDKQHDTQDDSLQLLTDIPSIVATTTAMSSSSSSSSSVAEAKPNSSVSLESKKRSRSPIATTILGTSGGNGSNGNNAGAVVTNFVNDININKRPHINEALIDNVSESIISSWATGVARSGYCSFLQPFHHSFISFSLA